MKNYSSRILVVDDCSIIRAMITDMLETEGFIVDAIESPKEALALSKQKAYDLIILDVVMDEMDGFTLCGKLRSITQTPVIFLSECTSENDKVIGLELGANDYLSKSIGYRELIARVRVQLRNGLKTFSASSTNNMLAGSELTLDKDARTVKGSSGEISLTTREFDLLSYLMENIDRAVSRNELLNAVWGWQWHDETSTIDTHIRRLRVKINNAGCNTNPIVTVRGFGYKFTS